MEEIGQYYSHQQRHQEQQQQRALFELLGVSEDAGVYVLIAGLVLVGLTVIACCYCKVYDPLRLWCLRMHKKWCTRKPRPPAGPPKDGPSTPERNHWYLNKTLKIDRQDRDELGPQGDRKGLKGGWYGARNGGFDV